MKLLFILLLTYHIALAQTDSTAYYDTVPKFFVLVPVSDTAYPYSLGQHQGWFILQRNVPGKDGCGNDIRQTIDMQIYLDEKKRVVDWTKYKRIEDFLN